MINKKIPVILAIAIPENGLNIRSNPKIIISKLITKVPIHFSLKSFMFKDTDNLTSPAISKYTPKQMATKRKTEFGK